MAIYYARKSGNVNATDVWATTPTGTAGDFFPSFTSSDTLMSNNFTITLNINTTILEVRNDNSNSATAGGSFTLSNGVTLTSSVSGNSCVNYSGSTFSKIIGNILPTTTYATAVNMTGTGTLYIVGTLGPSNFSYGECVRISSVGTLDITGTVYGPSASGGVGVYHGSTATVIVNGTVIGGSAGSVGYAIWQLGSGSLIINGTVIGGGGGTAVYQGSVGSITINGIAVGGSGSAGLTMGSTGSATVTRAKGNAFGPGSVGVTSQVGISNNQTSSVKVYEIEYGSLGQSPTSGPIELIGATSNVAVFATRFGSPKTLVDLNNAVNLVPSSGNVRSGTSYNYGNNVGTCVIPNSNSVVYGVPVDNVTGSGLLSPVAVWNALTSSIGTSGSIGERLKNCSTVSTVGKQLEGVL